MSKQIRSRRILDSANGRACVKCGALDGTVVAAHYTGFRQHSYGKGLGIKGHDLMTAHLCIKCHEYFDQYKWLENMACVEASEEFLHCIALTWVRLVNDGVIKI